MTAIVAFAIVALAFALGDWVAVKTKGIISSFVVVILFLLIGGGILGIIPGDVVATSGLSGIIGTFGMALLLTNLGSTLNLSELRREWQTVVVSLAGLIGIIIICWTVGQMIFGRETALAAIAPITGGVVATLLSTDAATAAGRADVALFVTCVMGLQNLIGIPISSICLKKSAKKYVEAGNLKKAAEVSTAKDIDIKFVPDTPASLDSSATHFCRLAVAAGLAVYLGMWTGINTTLLYLVVGALAGATGLIERDSLKKAGANGLVLLAAYAYVAKDFASMTLTQFTDILPSVVGMLCLGVIGIAIVAPLVGKLFKWDIHLSIATSIACMFGYPVTFAIPVEVTNGTKIDMKLTDEEAEKLQAYLMPKMVVAGVTSVSITSVIIAGVLIPMIFS